MSDSKPRLTHMMIDNVNERVSDTRKMIMAGVFLTLAFSAATFGLTLGAAEMAKESHVTSDALLTSTEGDVVQTYSYKEDISLTEVFCNRNRKDYETFLDSMRDVTDIDFLNNDGLRVHASATSFIYDDLSNTLTFKTTAGEDLVLSEEICEEEKSEGRALLGNGSGYSYTASSSSKSCRTEERNVKKYCRAKSKYFDNYKCKMASCDLKKCQGKECDPGGGGGGSGSGDCSGEEGEEGIEVPGGEKIELTYKYDPNEKGGTMTVTGGGYTYKRSNLHSERTSAGAVCVENAFGGKNSFKGGVSSKGDQGAGWKLMGTSSATLFGGTVEAGGVIKGKGFATMPSGSGILKYRRNFKSNNYEHGEKATAQKSYWEVEGNAGVSGGWSAKLNLVLRF